MCVHLSRNQKCTRVYHVVYKGRKVEHGCKGWENIFAPNHKNFPFIQIVFVDKPCSRRQLNPRTKKTDLRAQTSWEALDWMLSELGKLTSKQKRIRVGRCWGFRHCANRWLAIEIEKVKWQWRALLYTWEKVTFSRSAAFTCISVQFLIAGLRRTLRRTRSYRFTAMCVFLPSIGSLSCELSIQHFEGGLYHYFQKLWSSDLPVGMLQTRSKCWYDDVLLSTDTRTFLNH